MTFEEPHGTYELVSLETEEALEQYLEARPTRIRLVSRSRLPRIKFCGLYWPLSENAVRKLARLNLRCAQEGRLASIDEIVQIEGDDLRSIWEPMWAANPFLKDEK